MPLFDEMNFDQKWSLWDTWLSTISRGLTVAVITTQYRLIKVITAQNRLLKVITAQYRKLVIFTHGGY